MNENPRTITEFVTDFICILIEEMMTKVFEGNLHVTYNFKYHIRINLFKCKSGAFYAKLISCFLHFITIFYLQFKFAHTQLRILICQMF